MTYFFSCSHQSFTKCLALFVLLVTGIHVSAQSQSLDVHNFVELESSGTIPDDFLVSWADKLDQRMKSEKSNDLDLLELFWTRNHAVIDDLLQSGQLVFNDPFTNYLNKIKAELLKDEPALRDEIRIYTSKNPSLNAAAVADGVLIINIGLFAYAQTEAEIAFVLCHEIQHYKAEHILESFEKREALLEESIKEYKKLHYIKKFELLTQQSKEHEYEADELGLRLFYKSKYNSAAPINLLTLLHRSYLPYSNEVVGRDFLATSEQSLPETFFRDEINPITKEEDYFDDTHSHPNIFKRKIAIDPYLKATNGGSDFLVATEQYFLELREYARFERVNQLVNNSLYGDALYDIYHLKKKYPENKFLRMAEAKCLYSLSSFKVRDKISAVAYATGKLEGESQQVHSVIKEFNSVQLVSYSLHYVQDLQKKYGNEPLLDFYSDELARYLIVYCNVDIDEFAVETEQLPAFTQTEADFDNVRKYMRAKQKHYDSFYKYSLQSSFKNGRLGSALNKHKSEADSINAYFKLDAKSKKELNETIAEKRENGAELGVRKLVVLDPNIRVYGANDDPEEIREGLEEEQAFKALLPQLFADAGMEAELLYSENLRETDVVEYNKYAKLKMQLQEAFQFDLYNIKPPLVASSSSLGNKYSSNYICIIKGFIVEGKKDYFAFGIYDLKKGEFVYSYLDSQGYDLSLKNLEKETVKNLKLIYN